MNHHPYDQSEPLDFLYQVLDDAWEAICCAYDVQADLPDLENLFQHVNLNTPEEAAEQVVTNMLLDVISLVDRFSPYYTKPASDFGLISIHDSEIDCHNWVLTIDTYVRWLVPIQYLRKAIQKNSGVIQGMMLVENLLQESQGDPCLIAHCGCSPPRFIKIKRSDLEDGRIFCNSCLKPFSY